VERAQTRVSPRAAVGSLNGPSLELDCYKWEFQVGDRRWRRTPHPPLFELGSRSRGRGRPEKPFSAQQQQATLAELTEGVIGKEQAGALFELIDRLEPGLPVGKLTALLRRA